MSYRSFIVVGTKAEVLDALQFLDPIYSDHNSQNVGDLLNWTYVPDHYPQSLELLQAAGKLNSTDAATLSKIDNVTTQYGAAIAAVELRNHYARVELAAGFQANDAFAPVGDYYTAGGPTIYFRHGTYCTVQGTFTGTKTGIASIPSDWISNGPR